MTYIFAEQTLYFVRVLGTPVINMELCHWFFLITLVELFLWHTGGQGMGARLQPVGYNCKIQSLRVTSDSHCQNLKKIDFL